MGINRDEVIKRFAEKDYFWPNGRPKALKTARVFADAEDDRIYSYGKHFILSVRLPIGNKGIKFIINGDFYSASTTKHTNDCIHGLNPNVQIPFSALSNVVHGNYEKVKILDYVENGWKKIRYEEYKNDEILAIMKSAKIDTISRHDTEFPIYIQIDELAPTFWDHIIVYENTLTLVKNEHFLGATLFKYENKYYLSALMRADEIKVNQRRAAYFLVELPYPCATIKRAYEMLKPSGFGALEEGIGYKRQGEFFFLPTGITDTRELMKKIGKVNTKNKLMNGYITTSKRVLKMDDTKDIEDFEKWIKDNIENESFHPDEIVRMRNDETKEIAYYQLKRENKEYELPKFDHPQITVTKKGTYITEGEPVFKTISVKKNKDIAKLFRPDSNQPSGHEHRVRDMLITKKHVFIRGTITHPQHKPMRLGEEWHRVFISRAVHSWAATGRVD